MTRIIPFAVGEYYHAYNRGVDKRKVFLDRADYERFLGLLYLCNSGNLIHRSDMERWSFQELLSFPREEMLVDIGAFCLMSNHFHLLLHEHAEGGISKFMQKLGIAYTMFFNKRRERTGALFEGTFRARHANTDEYLKYLFAYIHLNPIGIVESEWKDHRIQDKKKAEEQLRTYRYSSYLDYAQPEKQRPEAIILNKSAFPEYFERPKDFSDHVNDWLALAEEAPPLFKK